MRIKNYRDVEAQEYKGDARGISIRQVIAEEDGAPTFVMRVFHVEPGGYTPRHSHAWEHEVFVLSGRGVVHGESGGDIQAGDAVFIPPDEEHQFENASDETLEFICVIPIVEG